VLQQLGPAGRSQAFCDDDVFYGNGHTREWAYLFAALNLIIHSLGIRQRSFIRQRQECVCLRILRLRKGERSFRNLLRFKLPGKQALPYLCDGQRCCIHLDLISR
jgi:hypothetical protein